MTSCSELKSIFNEFRSGSQDGYIQGLKILGPTSLSLPSLNDPHFQQKACHIISSLNTPSTQQGLANRLLTLEYIHSLSQRFGQKLTHELYSRIQTATKEALESGNATLSLEEKKEFEKRLEFFENKKKSDQLEFELPTKPKLPSLPSEEERIAYWKAVTHVTRSEGGHIGVYYTHGEGYTKDLVVKAPVRPMQEGFASRIFQKLEFLTPDTLCINRKSSEAKLIEKALGVGIGYEFTHFFIQNRIYGRTIEEIDEVTAASAFTNDSISIKELFHQIGFVAAVDTFLHYQDRLPHIGMCNWGNLMCIEKEKRLCFAVAIDQNVEISKPSLMGISKIDRIKETILNLSEAAQSIWEETPETLKKHISEEEALHVLQKGLETGFNKIKEQITPEVLDQIDQEFRDGYTDKDYVHTSDLKDILKIIPFFS